MKRSKFLMIILLLFPTLVYASSGNGMSIGVALGMELFVSIHMSAFVLSPLANMFSKDGNSKKLFLILFLIRAAILLIFDFFITPTIAILDFIAVFIGAFLVVPICKSITKKNAYPNEIINNQTISTSNSTTLNTNNFVLKCTKCNSVLKVSDKFCGKCGAAFDGNNGSVEMSPNTNLQTEQKTAVLPSQFDSMFSLPEDKMIEVFIDREMKKAGMDKNSKLIPREILKKKKIFNIIFSVLLFIYISLIFFHFPLATYIVGFVILFIFYKYTKKYDLMDYLKKQLKARPGEKVSNIVMSVKNTFVDDDSKKIFVPGVCIAVILSMLIFVNPRIMYEKMDNGYGVRFYTFGLTNFTTATIPEIYKNEKVISLRGNTFSNMPFLKEVTLPDTITEIRGQAFKNDRSLTKVNIPSKLEYLGGGAFYNCKSITSIELPDTVTFIGGEAFYNADSLKRVKLSNNITEIRGSTFENCSSLESITIPDSVTRIGGHAFYGNSSLSNVIISQNSKLTEIGSSAFRLCHNLYEITIPYDTYTNERAFKESPTVVKTYSRASKYDCKYDTFVVMKVGDTQKIDKQMSNEITQNEYISLISIVENNGLYEFTFNVNGQEFTLTSTYKYHKVNDNLVIEISSDYVFEHYTSQISFDVYYN